MRQGMKEEVTQGGLRSKGKKKGRKEERKEEERQGRGREGRPFEPGAAFAFQPDFKTI